MKVGDLVVFHNDSWIGPVPNMYKHPGLIETAYSDGTFEVFWPGSVGKTLATTRTLGPEALKVINE